MSKPGSTVTITHSGVTRTEIVKSVHYTSSAPAIWPKLSWWQRAARTITPGHWRKPLKPISAAKPAQVTLTYEGTEADAVARHLRQLSEISSTVDKLTKGM